VLGRNTTFQFKDQAVDIPTIAEKLGADYVVEGSIRRGGETVRVTAQLLGAEGGTHLWAEIFDRTLTPSNIFAVQDEITEAVAIQIADDHGVIALAEVSQIAQQAPRELSSYECTLRYHDHERASSPDSHRAVRDCLEAAVDSDPEYGLAYSYLSDIYGQEIYLEFNPRPDSSLEKGLKLAEKGVNLDPEDGRTHTLLALALLFAGHPDRALREVEEGLRLSPNNAQILGTAAMIYANSGRYDRAEPLMDRMAILNPNYPPWMNWNTAKIYLVRRDYAEAVSWLERSRSDWYHWTHVFIAAALCAQGEIENGKASLEKALEIVPNLAGVYWREKHMWYKGDGLYPLMEIVGSGLEACGWEVPPDPGPEAFSNAQ
jgi:adenylate cyclase